MPPVDLNHEIQTLISHAAFSDELMFIGDVNVGRWDKGKAKWTEDLQKLPLQ